MPQLPLFSAEGRPIAVPGTPSHLETPRSALATVAEEVNRAVQSTTKYAALLGAQKDEADYLQLRSEFELSMRSIMQESRTDPRVAKDPLAYTDVVAERGRDVFERLTKKIPRLGPQAWGLFQNYFVGKFPEYIIAARGEALKNFNANELVRLDTNAERLSQLAAESPRIDERDHYIDLFSQHITNATARNVLSEAAGRLKIQEFRQKVLAKHMDILRMSDRQELRKRSLAGEFNEVPFDVRFKILDQARKDEERDDAKAEKLWTKYKDLVINDWIGQANIGEVPDGLEDAIAGKHPIVDAGDARRVAEALENPPEVGPVLEIRAIMEQYRFERNTKGTSETLAQKYVDRLQRAALDIGRPTKAISVALDKIYTDLRTAQVETSKDFTDAMKLAMDQYDAAVPESSHLVPFLREKADNRRRQEKAEIRARLRELAQRGGGSLAVEASKLVEEYTKNWERRSSQRSQGQKNVDELKRSLPKTPPALAPKSATPPLNDSAQRRALEEATRLLRPGARKETE